MRYDRLSRLFLFALCFCGLIFTGCVKLGIENLKGQNDIYPEVTDPDAPLVVIIPGLRITMMHVPQLLYSGHFIEMLAEEGIPCRHILYDTKEHPLARKAAVFSEDLAIAWTRVGPGIVRELVLENERREKLGLPPVKRLVIFGFSQGSPIMEQIARKLFYKFPKQVEVVTEKFGDEWEALRDDPEFTSFIEAIEDGLVIKNIKVQREKEFNRVPDLRAYYDRTEKRVWDRFENLLLYLMDPSVKYPDVTEFEEPGSPIYPKRYDKLRDWAVELSSRSPEDLEEMREFFINYAEYRPLLDVTPSFFSAGGTYLGSPLANLGVTLLERFPVFKVFASREYKQVQQTEYGTKGHMVSIEELVELQKDDPYPIKPENTLFVLGTVGGRGDGFNSEQATHMSSHSYAHIQVEEPAGAEGGVTLTTVEETRLPDLVVVPLHGLHLPMEWRFGLGVIYHGVSYMQEDNPAYPYLLSFIRGDWEDIFDRIEKSDLRLRGFMLEVAFPDEETLENKLKHTGQSKNVKVERSIYNPDSNTVVWEGRFTGPGQEMNPAGEETVSGTVRLELKLDGRDAVPLDCAVYPGCSSFVKLTRE